VKNIIGLLFAALVTGVIAGSDQSFSPLVKKAEARLDMWVTVVMPFDPHDPKVRVTYSYVGGTDPITLELPDDDEVLFDTRLIIRVDDDPQKYKFPPEAADVGYGLRPTLKPEKQVELIVPLAKVLNLPPDWKKIEVTPVEVHPLNGIVQGITIIRKHKEPTPSETQEE